MSTQTLPVQSIWSELRRKHGWYAARRMTYAATLAAISELQETGPVFLSGSGKLIRRGEVVRLVFLQLRPKDFDVEVRTPC